MWQQTLGGIAAPCGFQASGATAGFKASLNPDLALLLAPEGAICAGAFTQSLTRAACIDLCCDRLQANSGSVRAVLINSGQANAFTGDRGLIDSLRATRALADLLQLKEEEVLIASTGIIGVPIPMQKMFSTLHLLVDSLSTEGGTDAAKAILTTDLVEKQIAFEADLGGRKVRIGGMAKGSGMIHPDMATMLGYITCDAGLPYQEWNLMVQRAVECSFNAITVDGDTSTNDMVLGFASGELLDAKYMESLEVGLITVMQYLSKAIARDGEGANCLIEVEVCGANNNCDARKVARTICGSSLVKTAIHGKDPNWGRIIAAAGRSGVDFNPENIDLWIGPYKLVEEGKPLFFDSQTVSHYIKKRFLGNYLFDDMVAIKMNIGFGDGRGLGWGCDMSDQYVRINADYTT